MSTPPAPARLSFDTPMKSAAIVTALLALLVALSLGSRFFSDARDRARRAGELQALADRQLRAGRFPEAWNALSQAAATIEEGSSLSTLAGGGEPQRQAVRTAREDLAMVWLQRWQPPEGSPPVSIPETLAPVLTTGAAAATGSRRADLLAHLGWEAAYRYSRDTSDTVPPEPEVFYRRAIEADPANPHAHAYWGHWLAVHGRLPEADTQFEAALASGRARPHVRSVQLAAWRSQDSRAFDTAYIAAVAAMVRNREPVDAAVRDRVYTLYTHRFEPDARFAELTAAVPAPAQIALVRMLFIDATDRRPDRTAAAYSWLARLQEAAGDSEGALASWRSVLSSLPPEASDPLADRARAAVAAARPGLLR